jgi:hypothetical protein
MIHDEIWEKLDMPAETGGHYLCIGCAESRLGRELTSEDFSPAWINRPALCDTPRLTARKSGRP